jgi:hypothetical protein
VQLFHGLDGGDASGRVHGLTLLEVLLDALGLAQQEGDVLLGGE